MIKTLKTTNQIIIKTPYLTLSFNNSTKELSKKDILLIKSILKPELEQEYIDSITSILFNKTNLIKINKDITKEDAIDYKADIIVFSIGALLKLNNRYEFDYNVNIDELIRFQEDRLLHKNKYNLKTELLNITEELIEASGYKSDEAREKAKEIVKNYKYSDLVYFEPKATYDLIIRLTLEFLSTKYNTQCIIDEVAKEINSRSGSIIEGKFVKDKSPEAQAKWYTANYKECKK